MIKPLLYVGSDRRGASTGSLSSDGKGDAMVFFVKVFDERENGREWE